MVSVTTAHAGSCHCGAVRFTVELPAEPRAARCDCSICSMKGAVAVGAPLAALEIVEGADKLTCYRFNTGVAKHWFCSVCGSYTTTSGAPTRLPTGSTSPASASTLYMTSRTCRCSTEYTTRSTMAAECALLGGCCSNLPKTKRKRRPRGTAFRLFVAGALSSS